MKQTLLRVSLTLLASFVLLYGVGCRSVYYSAYEKIGIFKRDLLKKDVIAARDEQKDAQKQFKDALTRLKEITHFDGGEAEHAYKGLKSEYDGCVTEADAVRKRIRDVEQVSADLFTEWESENAQISTPSLQATSRQQLITTRQKYNELHAALVDAEQSMDPVLRQFNDYVLVLKHNLNAQAIASLQGEATSITSEITRLIDQMNISIAHADEFVKAMK